MLLNHIFQNKNIIENKKFIFNVSISYDKKLMNNK